MNGEAQKRRWPLWFLLGFLALLIALKLVFFDWFTIPQAGMYPGLPQGAHFLALKRPYRDASDVHRGEVVIFTQSVGGQPVNFVWRVIGLPGETVAVINDSVTINGKGLTHEELRKDGSLIIYRETNGAAVYDVAYEAVSNKRPVFQLTVPAGQFFVLGDNRDHAQDSRYSGPVPLTAITGRKLRN